jgi:N-glycosylase/DNA lyase
MELTELRNEYRERKLEIRSRLAEFRKNSKAGKKVFFRELCYCICTPLSKAERVNAVIRDRNIGILMKGSSPSIASFLRGNCRFHKNKAKYIAEARGKLDVLVRLPKEPKEAREFLVRNVKGLGYKEASHFLRNMGYRGLAILDGHILSMLHRFGATKTNERPTSRKEYLVLEEKMKAFSKKVGIDIDELDLLFWSMRTGKVLK